MMVSSVLKAKRSEILRVADAHGAVDIKVFGSVARGEAKSASDLDFLVSMAPGRTYLDFVGLWQALEDPLGCPVDVVSVGGLSPYLRDRILDEARPL